MPAGGNSRFRGYPSRMSERQQLALILQMTSQDVPGSGSSSRSDNSSLSNARSSPVQHHKSTAKSRWSSKSNESQDAHTQLNRQDDRLRGVASCDPKDRNEFAGSISPDEVRQASGAESPLAAGSPAESAATCTTTANTAPDEPDTRQDQDDCEMRGTPPQNKVDRSSSSSSSSHQQQGRVTLRLNQVRATRDERKPIGPGPSSISSGLCSGAVVGQGAGTGSSRHSTLSTSQMDSSNTKSSGAGGASSTMAGIASSGGNSTSGANTGNNSSSSSADGGDVYEFKSSKEATPVRGSSSSPNPNTDKDGKESVSSVSGSSSCGGNQNIGSGPVNTSGNPVAGNKKYQQQKSSLKECKRERDFRVEENRPCVFDDEIVKCIKERYPPARPLIDRILREKSRAHTSIDALKANIMKYGHPTTKRLDHPFYEDAIQDLQDEFCIKNQLHAIPLSVTGKYLSNDKSPGLPWIAQSNSPPSRESVMIGRLSVFEKYWDNIGKQLPVDNMPDCAVCGHEDIGSIQNEKLEDDWIYPIGVLCQEARFFVPVIKEITEQRAFCSAGYGAEIMKGGMSWLHQEAKSAVNRYAQCKFVVLEYSDVFNAVLPEWLIRDCFKVLEDKFDFSKTKYENDIKSVEKDEEVCKFQKIVDYFINTTMRLPDGRRWKKFKGIPSGSLFSHLIATMATYLVSNTVIRMATQHRAIFTVVFGNKAVVAIPKTAIINLDIVDKISVYSFHLRLDTNSYWTTNVNNISFLGYYNHDGIPFKRTKDILPRLILPRYEKVDWIYRVSKALRFLLISAGSNAEAHEIARCVYINALQEHPEAVKKGIDLVKRERRKFKNLGCTDWEFSEELFSGISPRTNCQKLAKKVHLLPSS